MVRFSLNSMLAPVGLMARKDGPSKTLEQSQKKMFILKRILLPTGRLKFGSQKMTLHKEGMNRLGITN